jgi:chemotaxis protein CheX
MTTMTEGLNIMSADPDLFHSIVPAVDKCLAMCGVSARCVGASTVPLREPGRVTGIIGVLGAVSGFITVNMAELVARSAVAGLLQERFAELTPQVVDGVGEMTNIIGGGIKSGLAGTKWAFSHVTVPSVIIGNNYQISHAAGLHYFCAVFEHENQETLMLEDRLIQVAVSLVRL